MKLVQTKDGKNYLLPFILVTSLFFLWGFAMASLEANIRVELVIMVSTIRRPFSTRVRPVAVLSIIMSASSGGKTSVAP